MADISNGRFKGVTVGAVSALALLLSGCGPDGPFASLNLGPGQQDADTQDTAEAGTAPTVKTVERDVEAPEVFEVREKALWDGRPSLGGVWVAHPDNKEPERVIIRNESNGKFVVGALFRRERDLPGPSLQLSSDAAAALGVQAGSPTVLRVTALRREQVPVDPPAKTEPEAAKTTEEVTATALAPVETESLARKALAKADAGTPKPAAAATKPAATAVAPRPETTASTASKVERPYVQIGFFSVQDNAKSNVAALKANGIPARIVTTSTGGKVFWRVLAGPAASEREQKELMEMVRKQGYSDAYFVKG